MDKLAEEKSIAVFTPSWDTPTWLIGQLLEFVLRIEVTDCSYENKDIIQEEVAGFEQDGWPDLALVLVPCTFEEETRNMYTLLVSTLRQYGVQTLTLSAFENDSSPLDGEAFFIVPTLQRFAADTKAGSFSDLLEKIVLFLV